MIPVHLLQARSHLRSANRGDLVIPRSLTSKAGGRGFGVAGPKIWNSLPLSLRNYDLSCASFRSNLKTHLYGQSQPRNEALLRHFYLFIYSFITTLID